MMVIRLQYVYKLKCYGVSFLLSGMSLGFLVWLVGCRLFWGQSGVAMSLCFRYTCAGGAYLPGATSALIVGHSS